MNRPFQLVDVFHDGGYTGNPLAVVFDADDLATEQMQAMTRGLNLSESAFLLTPSRPGADYRVRISTLDRELPFAGHPTLGSLNAAAAGWLLDSGRVHIDRDSRGLWVGGRTMTVVSGQCTAHSIQDFGHPSGGAR